MTLEMVAESTAEFELPWLQNLNQRDRDAVVSFSKVKIEAGSAVYLDQSRQRFRMLAPGGTVLAWDQQRRIRVVPGVSCLVSWERPETFDVPSFGFSFQDGQWSILTENMAGNEGLFADFCGLMFDRQLNPHGLALEDGEYPSNAAIDFNVRFGRGGAPAALEEIKAFEPVDPLFPAKFLAEFTDHFDVKDAETGGITPALKGMYAAEIVAWNQRTGEVYVLSFSGTRRFKTTGSEIVRAAEAGKFNILKINQRSMDTY